ncbi:unnamed protein product [Periconia digitata]|uniref:Uncharacterized protein n=1 Tax=Periconia digitata TaxID=1303443 RepID=A0A9W4U2Q3_9PLEO|nr:unnamed protein product [Periconia digitata]
MSTTTTTTTTALIQLTSITTALLSSGAITTLSIFDIPEIRSQPASRALPLTRWLFSRGSHIFPTASALSTTGFLYLAYTHLPSSSSFTSPTPWTQITDAAQGQAGLYALAALLTASIAPVTMFIMLPTNFRLIRINEELGGSRSAESAAAAKGKKGKGEGVRSAEESVDGKGDVSQWSDLSGP